MSQYHAHLALEYFQARSLVERTVDALRDIVQHISQTYMLSAPEEAQIQADALALATAKEMLAP